MSDYYFDADAQVKLHLSEAGSVWVRGLARATETNGELLHQLYTVDVSQVEVSAALAVAFRAGRIDAETQAAAFERYFSEVADTFQLIPVNAGLIVEAVQLTQKHSLKALDAFHVAAALQLSRVLAEFEFPLTVVSSDHQVLTAARAENLPVENPRDHPDPND